MTNLAVSSLAGANNAASTAASTTASSTASSTGSASSASSASTLTQSDFLKLLIAQLQYQTPTSPADPTQLAEEFASISTVNGINQLNTEVSNIQSGNAASQLGAAAGLVGKQVAVSGNKVMTNGSGAATGAFDLAGAAQDVTVSLTGPSGAAAGTIDLGQMAAGQQSFSLTGGAANTQYSYSVTAVSPSGAVVGVTPYSVYTVNGVNVSGATPTLNVQGSAAALPVSSIQTVLGASS
jgi:flagellar basal-body rod modification protein FlgD